MARRLRLGVIGAGRTWGRYRRTLAALRGQWRIGGIWDHVAVRAEEQARRLGIAPVGGVVEMVERDDLDAILVAGLDWTGLWPVEQAVRAGKPVFCAASLADDEEGADRLTSMVRDDTLLRICPWPALELLSDRIGEGLETMGPARWVRGEWQGPTDRSGPLATAAAAEMLRAVVAVVGMEPATIQTRIAGRVSDFASILIDFEDGQVAQVGLWAGDVARATGRLAATTAKGEVRAELPGRLDRDDAEGRRTETVSSRSGRVLAMARFAQAVRDKTPGNFAEAYRALGWLRAARHSATQGRLVDLRNETTPAKPG